MLGGLALGREGPSIQLGAMAGKGISHALDRSRTEEKYLLTCGAAAGLSAAFQAPLAGVMFSLEEVHKNFSVSVLVSVMSASLTADSSFPLPRSCLRDTTGFCFCWASFWEQAARFTTGLP